MFRITDTQGVDMILTREAFARATGAIGLQLDRSGIDDASRILGDRVRQSLRAASGFMGARDFDYLITYGRKAQFDLEDIACPVGLGGSGRAAPALVTAAFDFVVLPATPPGVYTVHIPAQLFCAMSRWDPRHDYANPPTTLSFRVEG
jgi:hypothetical protein